jgi:hypothetical protein
MVGAERASALPISSIAGSSGNAFFVGTEGGAIQRDLAMADPIGGLSLAVNLF